MSTLQLAHHGLAVLAAGDDGEAPEEGAEFGDLGVAPVEDAVAGIGFVIFQALASRGAFARIIISGLAAGVFIWIVWNVTDLRDRVDREVRTPAAIRLQPDPGGGGARVLALAGAPDAAGPRRSSGDGRRP